MKDQVARFTDVFFELENNFGASYWRCGNVYIWPLVKFMIAREIDDYVGGKTMIHLSRDFSARRWASYASQIASECVSSLFDSKAEKADICLLTYNTFRHYPVDGRWFNIFHDPLRHFSNIAGKSVATLEILNVYPARRPHFSPTHPVSLEMAIARAAGLAGITPGIRKSELNDLHAKIESVREVIGLDNLEPLLRRVDDGIGTLFMLARFFERYLGKIAPRRVIMANYYSVSGLALCLAASRLGIPSADISHGSSGQLHYAYSGWQGHPKGGYEILPRDFLVRNKGDGEALTTLVAGGTHHSEPTLVGDLADLAWQDNAFGLAEEARRFLERSIGSFLHEEKQLDVLVAVQNLDSLDENLLETMRRTSSWCRFWVRCHPIYLAKIDMFQMPQDLAVPDIKAVTTTPLFALLERVDAVLTESSSVAEDGLSWGVPAIITHPFGQKMFENYIASGQMMQAATVQEIVAKLELLRDRKQAGIRTDTQSVPNEVKRANLLAYLAAI